MENPWEASATDNRLWVVVPDRYDDGGFPGGNVQRPGMQRLLADFAKIVEVLDKAGASFVSITQSFNTTTSMGRLPALVRESTPVCHEAFYGFCYANALQWVKKESRMPANALIQTRIDAKVKARASAVLETMGLTVSDVVRILLTRTAREGALPFELVADPKTYDAWFRAKVREALEDPRPDIADEDVEAEFAARRAVIQKQVQ